MVKINQQLQIVYSKQTQIQKVQEFQIAELLTYYRKSEMSPLSLVIQITKNFLKIILKGVQLNNVNFPSYILNFMTLDILFANTRMKHNHK